VPSFGGQGAILAGLGVSLRSLARSASIRYIILLKILIIVASVPPNSLFNLFKHLQCRQSLSSVVFELLLKSFNIFS
jgi:hypothetical protein